MIGLGIIGSAWAQHLEADGVLSATWNRTPKVFPRFQQDLAAIPAQADLIHIVVSDELALGSVIQVLAPSLTARHVVIQSTTIDPASSDSTSAVVEAQGARYLEAPFTGSLPGALSRKTLFYLGGEASLVANVTPYLKRLSEQQIRIGTPPQACTLKLAMNLQIAAAVAALAESISICRNADISDPIFFEALASNAASSKLTQWKEALMCSGEFPAQFSTKHMAKDMRLLGSLTKDNFVLHASILEKLRLAMENGFGDEDFSAMVKLHKKNS